MITCSPDAKLKKAIAELEQSFASTPSLDEKTLIAIQIKLSSALNEPFSPLDQAVILEGLFTKAEQSWKEKIWEKALIFYEVIIEICPPNNKAFRKKSSLIVDWLNTKIETRQFADALSVLDRYRKLIPNDVSWEKKTCFQYADHLVRDKWRKEQERLEQEKMKISAQIKNQEDLIKRFANVDMYPHSHRAKCALLPLKSELLTIERNLKKSKERLSPKLLFGKEVSHDALMQLRKISHGEAFSRMLGVVEWQAFENLPSEKLPQTEHKINRLRYLEKEGLIPNWATVEQWVPFLEKEYHVQSLGDLRRRSGFTQFDATVHKKQLVLHESHLSDRDKQEFSNLITDIRIEIQKMWLVNFFNTYRFIMYAFVAVSSVTILSLVYFWEQKDVSFTWLAYIPLALFQLLVLGVIAAAHKRYRRGRSWSVKRYWIQLVSGHFSIISIPTVGFVHILFSSGFWSWFLLWLPFGVGLSFVCMLLFDGQEDNLWAVLKYPL